MNPKVILDQFRHQPGGSCIATALSNIFNFHGFKYSQEFIIGAGLNFGFISDPMKKIWNVEFISSKMLFQILLGNTGIFGEEIQMYDNDNALHKLLTMIDGGIPVAVKLDPAFSEGLQNTTSPELIPYLPSHNVVAYGYDLNRKKVYLYDSPSFNHLEMDMDKFCEGRNSGKTEPMNTYYELYFPKESFPKEISLKLAILGTIERFKYTKKYLNFRTGFTALDRFAGNVKNWRNDLTDDEIVERARSFKMSITNGQAIKGAFRNHFALFLQEASKSLPYNFDNAINIYKDLASYWTDTDRFLNQIIEDSDKDKFFNEGSLFIELLEEIVDLEKKAIDLLENTIYTK